MASRDVKPNRYGIIVDGNGSDSGARIRHRFGLSGRLIPGNRLRPRSGLRSKHGGTGTIPPDSWNPARAQRLREIAVQESGVWPEWPAAAEARTSALAAITGRSGFIRRLGT